MFKKASILCVLLLATCQQNDENIIIEPDKMRQVYLDMLHSRLALSAIDTVEVDIEEVLENYSVSDSLFKASLQYYEDHPDEWLLILNAVIDSLEAEKKSHNAGKPGPSSPSPFSPKK